jgi:hypothetical protein
MKSGRPQHDLPAASVIAQQYSSTATFSVRFHSGKEKFGASSKTSKRLSFNLFTFLKLRKN